MRIRRLIIVLFVVAWVIPMVAQPEVGTFSLVPRLGVDIANISGDHAYQYNTVGSFSLEGKYRSDFTGGLEAMYQFMPNLAVSVGVMYAAEGCRYSDVEVGTGETRVGFNHNHVKMEYLQVPVMAHYYVAQGLSVNAGIRLGFLLAANHEYDVTDITYHELSGTRDYGETSSQDVDIKDLCKKTAISIPIGISYEYMNVVLDARYHFPLTKTCESGIDGKARSLTVTVGYKFDF